MPDDQSRYDAALRFLYGRVDYERFHTLPASLRLDRMRRLLALLGNPQQGFDIVHVAGTKGKGSTSAMIAAVLSAAGYRTGLFTSPHIDRLEERMTIDGLCCTPAELVELVQRVRPVVEAMDGEDSSAAPGENRPTFFEIITALALICFANRGVDVAVLEVGLGGRLDSTNVCQPRVSVITSISLDHTQQLGDTVESIAREKVGIVRPDVPVVSGVVDPTAREVIRQACRELGSPLVELATHFDFDYAPPRHLEQGPAQGRLTFHFRNAAQPAYRDLPLALPGRHQAANASLALAVVEELKRQGYAISEDATRRGLAGLVWPARVEVVGRQPAVVVDAAHNVASVDALLETLGESFSVARRVLVFAGTRDKDIRGMLNRLLSAFDSVVLTQYGNNPRAVPVAELAAIAEELTGCRCPMHANSADAWDEACQLAGPDDLICATGSFFLAAEIRQLALHDDV